MSGLSYSPPIYYFNNITYDPAFFANNNEITQAYLNQRFLPRIGIALSTATLTSFQGTVECYGLVSLYGGLSITGGLTLDTLTVNGLATFNTAPLMSGASITSNTIPALSIVNGSITQTQVSTGLSFVNLGIQNFGGAKTFNNSLTTNGITDNINISSPYYTSTSLTTNSQFTGVNVSGNLNVNTIRNPLSSQMNIYSGSVSIPGGTNVNGGLQIGWNNTGGAGETNFTNLAQGGTIANPSGGGFQFGTTSNNLSYRALCAMNPYSNQGFWLFSNCGRLRIDDRNGGAFWWGQSMEGSQMLCSVNGISTSFTVGCTNSLGVGSTCLSVSTTGVTISPPLNTSSTITSTGIISAPSYTATNSAGTSNFWGLQTGDANISGTLSTANITAQGTTTFNTSHPTTTLGNNISTNTTQYATVGFVNVNSGSSLLTLNNTWTGTNTFSTDIIANGNISKPILNFTAGVTTTFTTLPPVITFTPAPGMVFLLPTPSASNQGQQVFIRKNSAGTGIAITFQCVGLGNVFCSLNNPNTSAVNAYTVTTVFQSQWIINLGFYYQIS